MTAEADQPKGIVAWLIIGMMILLWLFGVYRLVCWMSGIIDQP